MPGDLRVIATAGHVDHGKSTLIASLTGIDPDRWAEEKRRGLTIDLGYAWTTLPSGREVGFVDVPGHERFIRNMLAGVGPVRLVLFIVAADEGWKPQSEEHLQILDVLGIEGAIIALTKRDLVDEETLAIARDEVHERIVGTALESAPVIAVSAHTGEGIDALRAALDAMLDRASQPADARMRLFVDRVFTIKGAGTVVTGTLAGEDLAVGEEIAVLPAGERARVRSLQTHKRQEDRAAPVSRVAANLVGLERSSVERGHVLGRPGAWRATRTFDAAIHPVRDLDAIPSRGAFTVHAGAAESAATVRLAVGPDGTTYARLRSIHPLVLEPGDRFVLREEGRRATVGGGQVLDVAPPRAFARPAHLDFLVRRRAATSRADLARLLVTERGAIATADLLALTGATAPEDVVIGGWAVDPAVRAAITDALTDALATHHRDHPLEDGAPLEEARSIVLGTLRAAGAPRDRHLAEALLGASQGVVREAATVRLPGHRVALDERSEDVERLLEALGGAHEAAPPTVKELLAGGFGADLLEAAARAGTAVRIAPDLLVHPAFLDRARAVVTAHAADGISVSALRETLGTSRKYAVPLLEWMDAQGLTRRVGDLRFPRSDQ